MTGWHAAIQLILCIRYWISAWWSFVWVCPAAKNSPGLDQDGNATHGGTDLTLGSGMAER